MSFRADLIKLIEHQVSMIEKNQFKIDDSMKTNFVAFVNAFFKHHLGTSDIDFKLTPQLLYAEVNDVRVIIATDRTKEFKVPGCNIGMRHETEAFVLVGSDVGYDSFIMRRFLQCGDSDSNECLPTYVVKDHGRKTGTSTTEEKQHDSVLLTSSEVKPAPDTFISTLTPITYSNSSTPKQASLSSFAPAPSSSFAPAPTTSFAPAPTSSFAPAPTTSFAPAPTTSFAPAPTTSSFAPAPTTSFAPTSTPSAASSLDSNKFSGFNFGPKPQESNFNAFSKNVNVFGRVDSASSIR